MDLKTFAHPDWTKVWAGNWSLLTCSHFDEQYTEQITFDDFCFMSQSIIFVEKGRSEAWMRQADKDKLGHFLAQEIKKKKKFAEQACRSLKKEVDEVLAFIKSVEKKKITLALYKKLWNLILQYYPAHITIKYSVDYLDLVTLQKLLPAFQKARVYAEPVFTQSEELMMKIAQDMGKEYNYQPELVLCMLKEEMYDCLEGKGLPSRKVLEGRYNGAVLVCNREEYQLFTASKIEAVRTLVMTKEDDKLTGACAFPGRVNGVVRIVTDPAKVKVFQQGDILVTGMTRPEFLLLIKKAGAVVTDAGGMLSHAAITARELKIPTIVGTKVATKVLKDGDVAEVDADKGVVKKL